MTYVIKSSRAAGVEKAIGWANCVSTSSTSATRKDWKLANLHAYSTKQNETAELALQIKQRKD